MNNHKENTMSKNATYVEALAYDVWDIHKKRQEQIARTGWAMPCSNEDKRLLDDAGPLLALTVKRLAKLAETMDQYADRLEAKSGDDDEQYIEATRIAVDSIRDTMYKVGK